jgi:hypothetical protein
MKKSTRLKYKLLHLYDFLLNLKNLSHQNLSSKLLTFFFYTKKKSFFFDNLDFFFKFNLYGYYFFYFHIYSFSNKLKKTPVT